MTADTAAADAGPPSSISRRPRPGWLTAPWLMLLLPVLASTVDAVLVTLDTPWWQRALAALATLALLLRRRCPVLVLLLTLPASFVTFIWIAQITAVYSVASRRTRPWAAAAGACAFALSEFFHWPLADHPLAFDRDNALYAIQCAMLGAAPTALGMLARTRRELAVRLDELTKGQQRESRLLAERVLATERARLAREMHDVVSHQVSLISIQAGALQVSTADPAARSTAVTIRELSVRTLEELRQMVGVLRAAGVRRDESLAPQPRLADLPRLIADSGLCVKVRLGTGDRPWPEAVERAAYRTVQEALTNISKHAPGAQVDVVLATRGTRLLVEVRNGRPPRLPGQAPLPGGGHGLVGLRERAQLLGGAFSATATPDGGFTVCAELPAVGE
ncbi:sensor histidine kinase [Kitasatospora sp. HPMI-4]|uniref:sensor histidine kinase n=1 Tax=Kitasatospora sp. HPMI-4 TaxID=3448443 RepID=UPI003F1D6F87